MATHESEPVIPSADVGAGDARDAQEAEPVVSKAASRNRFEIALGDERAGMTLYLDHSGRRIFYHTEVDERFSGQGLAAVLVAKALDDTRAEGLRIVPVCPYVAAYVKRHHAWDDVLDPVTPQVLHVLNEAAP